MLKLVGGIYLYKCCNINSFYGMNIINLKINKLGKNIGHKIEK